MPDEAIRGSSIPKDRPRPSSALPAPLRNALYSQSCAANWQLSPEGFASALDRVIAKHFPQPLPDPHKLEDFLSRLHLQDLALACACSEGSESAWEHFVATYRPYLRAAAAAVLRCPPNSPEARDLADSLFTDLYGIADGRGPDRSLFRYFHGRSSLKTWLRAVLAQRHIDAIRSARRFVDIDGEAQSENPIPQLVTAAPPADPHRDRYQALFRRALQTALAGLDSRDAQRLRSYYLEDHTLAAIGRALGEHESSVSRHLDRIRRVLREEVESLLRAGFSVANGSAAQPGLSDAEIALCFQYAAEDAPINLDALFPPASRASSADSVPPRKPAKISPEEVDT
ncbi:MAG TPA: sigma-70 family RNA polymerase sigma factor [Candidatus Acidoferrales bacterium]|nr:sigma-70 family RNA polymerase sigma factor [Candidatus Acidoferrales bacterium]